MLLFQPAEEAMGGARKMIEDGALQGVEAVAGMHVWPSQPPGDMHNQDPVTLGLRMGSSGRIQPSGPSSRCQNTEVQGGGKTSEPRTAEREAACIRDWLDTWHLPSCNA